MKGTTIYPGIDYSGPGATCNRNLETGIRYGVISQHSINPDALDDIYHGPHSTDLTYQRWETEVRDAILRALDDLMPDSVAKRVCDAALDCDWLGDGYQGDETDPEYDDGDYHITKCLDSDLFISRSPFFTYAQFCSPCVPGACNLDSPLDDSSDQAAWPDSNKCYCLDKSWFENEACPYPYWDMSGKPVYTPCKS